MGLEAQLWKRGRERYLTHLKSKAPSLMDEQEFIRLGATHYHPDDLPLDAVADNIATLKAHGVYELVLVYTFVLTNHADLPLGALEDLFLRADRERLRAAGAPLPGRGPFVVYRGVSGYEPYRRVRGLSWTSSFKVARDDFAMRFRRPDPGVYRVTIKASHVLAYVVWRKEKEFIVILPHELPVERVWTGYP